MGLARDINCGTDVGLMDKLGRFDREFIVYGCGYMENQTIKYRLSRKAEQIYEFINQSAPQKIYPTPVKQLLVSCQVPAGTKEDIAQEAKITLAKQLQASYGKRFFHIIDYLGNLPATDESEFFLLAEQEKVEGRFQADDLNQYEGLVRMALEAKVLTLASYQEMMQWLAKNRKQMEDDVIIKNTIQRTFAGFAYMGASGQLNYYSDGQKETVYEKWRQMMAEGVLTSQVLLKSYWFDNCTPVKVIRRKFEDFLRQRLDGNYLEMVRKIKNLPSAISHQDAQTAILLQKILNEDEQKAFAAYRYRWHIE